MNNPDTIESLQALSPDEIRVRVAELMGWRGIYPATDGPMGFHVSFAGGKVSETIPNYPASLDSCREFEDAMTDEEHDEYRKHLRSITAKDAGTFPTTDKSRRAYLSATPLQKCQAYILTKGAA